MRALVGAGFEVALVVSQPDRRRGRGGGLRPTPVKAAALALGLAVSDQVGDVVGSGADLGVVVAYGRLVRPPVLAAVPMVNVHFSLLPRWRGAAPVERAILAGDAETGVCLMALEAGLDTGPVHDRRRLAIGPEETADELRGRLVELATELLVTALDAGLPEPHPQEGEVTYAAKLERAELALDWNRPAAELHRVVRVGGAWTTVGDRRLKVHRARLAGGAPGSATAPPPGVVEGTVVGTGAGALELVTVQPEGRSVQGAAAWLRGARLAPGQRLGG
ncbi:MAG: methionyl-tRNA formyltransferase [Acidimicrobiales bacterium]